MCSNFKNCIYIQKKWEKNVYFGFGCFYQNELEIETIADNNIH